MQLEFTDACNAPIRNETRRRILSGEITRREATFRSLFLRVIHRFPIRPPIVALPSSLSIIYLRLFLFLSSRKGEYQGREYNGTEEIEKFLSARSSTQDIEKDWQALRLGVNFRIPSDAAAIQLPIVLAQ